MSDSLTLYYVFGKCQHNNNANVASKTIQSYQSHIWMLALCFHLQNFNKDFAFIEKNLFHRCSIFSKLKHILLFKMFFHVQNVSFWTKIIIKAVCFLTEKKSHTPKNIPFVESFYWNWFVCIICVEYQCKASKFMWLHLNVLHSTLASFYACI